MSKMIKKITNISFLTREISRILLVSCALTLLIFILFQYAPGTSSKERPFNLTFNYSIIERGQIKFDSFLKKVWITTRLTLIAMATTAIFSLPVSLNLSIKKHLIVTKFFLFFSYFISVIPIFFTAHLVLFFITSSPDEVIGGTLGIKLISLRDSVFGSKFFAGRIDYKSTMNLILPGILLGLCNGSLAEVIRGLKEETSALLSHNYVKAAVARGGSVFFHVHRALIIAVTAILTMKLTALLGGAVVIESIFGIMGIGQSAYLAVKARDFYLSLYISFYLFLIHQLFDWIRRFTVFVMDKRITR